MARSRSLCPAGGCGRLSRAIASARRSGCERDARGWTRVRDMRSSPGDSICYRRHAHHHQRAAAPRGEVCKRRRSLKRPDVVEDRRARVYRGFRDFELVRVDRDWHARPLHERLDHPLGAADLLGYADRLVARTRRLAADVEHCRALARHSQALRDGALGIVEPVTAEGVRARVDDAHHVRARTPVESVTGALGAHHWPIMLRSCGYPRWREGCQAQSWKAMAALRSAASSLTRGA